jgi:hypothetical protein
MRWISVGVSQYIGLLNSLETNLIEGVALRSIVIGDFCLIATVFKIIQRSLWKTYIEN